MIEKITSFFRKNSAILLFVIGLLTVLIAVFLLIDHFDKGSSKTLWEKLQMFGSVVVGIASATIAYLVHDYNRKRQEEERQRRDEELKRQETDKQNEAKRQTHELELQRIETLRGLIPQLFSNSENDKAVAISLIKILTEKTFSLKLVDGIWTCCLVEDKEE
jgi:hypothetical protein